jgi:hypothetical protein
MTVVFEKWNWKTTEKCAMIEAQNNRWENRSRLFGDKAMRE